MLSKKNSSACGNTKQFITHHQHWIKTKKNNLCSKCNCPTQVYYIGECVETCFSYRSSHSVLWHTTSHKKDKWKKRLPTHFCVYFLLGKRKVKTFKELRNKEKKRLSIEVYRKGKKKKKETKSIIPGFTSRKALHLLLIIPCHQPATFLLESTL